MQGLARRMKKHELVTIGNFVMLVALVIEKYSSRCSLRRASFLAEHFPVTSAHDRPQHFLYFCPLPHGHAALRPG
jgi:hypothetical protein